jgi:hypothetical protein
VLLTEQSELIDEGIEVLQRNGWRFQHDATPKSCA